MEWISVKKQLPEPYEDVTIKLVDGTILYDAFRSYSHDVFLVYGRENAVPFEDVIEWE